MAKKPKPTAPKPGQIIEDDGFFIFDPLPGGKVPLGSLGGASASAAAGKPKTEAPKAKVSAKATAKKPKAESTIIEDGGFFIFDPLPGGRVPLVSRSVGQGNEGPESRPRRHVFEFEPGGPVVVGTARGKKSRKLAAEAAGKLVTLTVTLKGRLRLDDA